MMRTLCFLLAIALVCSAPLLFAQAKSDFPRGPDGKPDLTGVWQGGSRKKAKCTGHSLLP